MNLFELSFYAIALVILICVFVLLFGIKKKLEGQNLGEAIGEIKRLKSELDEMEHRLDREIAKTKTDIENEVKGTRIEITHFVQNEFKMMGEMIAGNQKESAKAQDMRLAELSKKFSDMSMQSEQKLEHIRQSMVERINTLTDENNKQLELMRNTVDEKLQKTLEDRITKSFMLVSERLEEVYKGLGEMQNLAIGVGDLKKVLSNVKTRGILGEIQLGAILEQILSPEQYETNIATKRGSRDRVEYAIKLPGEGDVPVYLPIDAKFPADTYTRLQDAYEQGVQAEIAEATKLLISRIKSEAKDIKEKYVYPPETTDFAILFLPVEGLYAEVVRTPGLVEALQREYKIVVAGPTNMAALLNSLQMGFRTLAIQKHSSQVWDVLGAVKTEFDKFGTVLSKTQQKLMQANQELDTLIGTRTNVIRQKLRSVQKMTDAESMSLLGTDSLALLSDIDIDD